MVYKIRLVLSPHLKIRMLPSLLILVAVSTPRVISLSVLAGRIIGGEETSILNHPYQASLQYFGFFACGASIISERFVVTAAHCTTG